MIPPIVKLYFVGMLLFTIASLPFLLFIFFFQWFGFALYSGMVFLFFCFPETLINLYGNHFKNDIARTMRRRARWGVQTSSDEVERIRKADAIINNSPGIPPGALPHLHAVGLLAFSGATYFFWRTWAESSRQVHLVFFLTYLLFSFTALLLALSRSHRMQ